jgi:hypothetical protein
MPYGVYRRVLLVGGLAIKLPRLGRNRFSGGMRSNRWEREMWRLWRIKYGWENLCPVLFADSFGLMVIMSRAAPVSWNEVQAENPDYYPSPTDEYSKPEDYGRLHGRIVAVDYGLPDEDLVKERRAYYTKTHPLSD